MPTKNQQISPGALTFYQSISYEFQVASWLLKDGWEVFQPMIDHGMKTDLLISNGKQFYRIQVKSVTSTKQNIKVEADWNIDAIDYVIYFSRQAGWGYITQPFEGKRKLNDARHWCFHQNSESFIEAFALA